MYTPSSTEGGALEEQKRQRDTSKNESEPQHPPTPAAGLYGGATQNWTGAQDLVQGARLGE